MFINQTLEALVHRCGRRVQAEVGKFRFLNELIKLLSPKVFLMLIYYNKFFRLYIFPQLYDLSFVWHLMFLVYFIHINTALYII